MNPEGTDGPLVVKLGGGLLRGAGGPGRLGRACAELTTLAAGRPVLVVPGGGPFADAVRAVDARHRMGDALAHELALRAMDQFGLLLAERLPAAETLERLVAPGALAVLRAAPAFAHHPELPRSWAVTSDSLAVLAAGVIGAREAVLLKAVPGVLPHWPGEEPPLPTLSAAQLQALQDRGGGRAVDAYLPEAVRRTGVSVIVREPAGIGWPAGAGTRIMPG